MPILGKTGARLGLLAIATAASGPAASAQHAAAPAERQVEEIVVTARRTGIPVWRVTGPTTSIVLIGSIAGVAKQTRWEPGPLETTLRKADRVMFPGATSIALSPFKMIGYYAKWRRMATLPKGRTLADLLPPEQFRKLVALEDRGILKRGFERKHPWQLAQEMRRLVDPEDNHGPGAGRFVQAAVKKHRLTMVPIRTIKSKPVARDFFATPPHAYVPCLVATIALVEAGPTAVRARSDAWAQRRVADVLDSPADKVFESCIPPALEAVDRPDLRSQIRGLMGEKQVTVAVVNLRTLAEPGGVLDHLAAAGFSISGPAWKR